MSENSPTRRLTLTTNPLQLEWKQTFAKIPRYPAPADSVTSSEDTDGCGDTNRDREIREFLDGVTVTPKLFKMPDIEEFLKKQKSKKKPTSLGGSLIEKYM